MAQRSGTLLPALSVESPLPTRVRVFIDATAASTRSVLGFAAFGPHAPKMTIRVAKLARAATRGNALAKFRRPPRHRPVR
jgi:hypothetical protein